MPHALCLEYRISMPRISDLYAWSIGYLCLEYPISMPRISDFYARYAKCTHWNAYGLHLMHICSAMMEFGPGSKAQGPNIHIYIYILLQYISYIYIYIYIYIIIIIYDGKSPNLVWGPMLGSYLNIYI